MKKKEIGFSLIEVVMALAILGIAILPILSMYPSALKMTTDATRNEEWSRVSMTIVDYVKSRGYDNVKGKMTSSKFDKEYVFTYDSSTNSYKQNSFSNESFVRKRPHTIYQISLVIFLRPVNFYYKICLWIY